MLALGDSKAHRVSRRGKVNLLGIGLAEDGKAVTALPIRHSVGGVQSAMDGWPLSPFENELVALDRW